MCNLLLRTIPASIQCVTISGDKYDKICQWRHQNFADPESSIFLRKMGWNFPPSLEATQKITFSEKILNCTEDCPVNVGLFLLNNSTSVSRVENIESSAKWRKEQQANRSPWGQTEKGRQLLRSHSPLSCEVKYYISVKILCFGNLQIKVSPVGWWDLSLTGNHAVSRQSLLQG